MVWDLVGVDAVRGAVLLVGAGDPGPCYVLERSGPVVIRRAAGDIVAGWQVVRVAELVVLPGESAAADCLTVAERVTASAGDAVEVEARDRYAVEAVGGRVVDFDAYYMGGGVSARVSAGVVVDDLSVVGPLTAAGLFHAGLLFVVGSQLVGVGGAAVKIISVLGRVINPAALVKWLVLLHKKKGFDLGFKDYNRIDKWRDKAVASSLPDAEKAAILAECILIKRHGWRCEF